jgi:hypothetical protein
VVQNHVSKEMCTVSITFQLFFPNPVCIIHKHLYKNEFSCLIQLSEIALPFSPIKIFTRNALLIYG